MSESVLLCRTGHDAGLSVPVGREPLVLGRGEDADAVLDHEGVEPRHAVVQTSSDGASCSALAAGVVVAGRELGVGETAPLPHLAALRIGPVDLVHVDRTQVPSTEVLAAALVAPGGVRVPLAVGVNRMGSGEDCDLVVDDEAVRATHVVLTLSARGLLVEPGADDATVRLGARAVPVSEWARDGDELWLADTATFPLAIVRGLGAPAHEMGERTGGQPSSVLDGALGADAARDDDEAVADADAPTAGMPRIVREDLGAEPPSPGDADPADTTVTTRTSESTVRRALARHARREAAVRLHVTLAEAADGGSPQRVVLLREGRHVVGRAADCRAWLPDLSVSRRHAEIDIRADGVVVRDLGSANGTWAADERVEELRPEPGERFRFGDVVAWLETVDG